MYAYIREMVHKALLQYSEVMVYGYANCSRQSKEVST